jgi:Zn-dependent peptidase ImmA (M78 family)
MLGVDDDQPVNCFCLEKIDQLFEKREIGIFYYSDFEPKVPYEKIVQVYGADGAAVMQEGRKFIVLNDRTTRDAHASAARPVWTKMHEYGHIDLGHLNCDDCIRLRSSAYDALEHEADTFVANFLMPHAAVKAYLRKLDAQNCTSLDSTVIGNITNHFTVSWTAAIHRLDALEYQPKALSHWLVSTYNDRKKRAKAAGAKLDHFTDRLLKSHRSSMDLEQWKDKLNRHN